jgi:hypothetical protein
MIDYMTSKDFQNQILNELLSLGKTSASSLDGINNGIRAMNDTNILHMEANKQIISKQNETFANLSALNEKCNVISENSIKSQKSIDNFFMFLGKLIIVLVSILGSLALGEKISTVFPNIAKMFIK